MHFWEPISERADADYLKLVELDYDEKTNEIVAPTFRQDIHRLQTWQRK